MQELITKAKLRHGKMMDVYRNLMDQEINGWYAILLTWHNANIVGLNLIGGVLKTLNIIKDKSIKRD